MPHKLLSISAYLIGKLENNHYILAHKALHQVGLAIIGPLHAT
jgi:hypothetical protein